MPEIFSDDTSFSAEMDGSDGSVKVGGHDISDSIHAFTVDATAGHRPRVTLELSVHNVTRIESEHTEVVMSSATRDLLIAAGWQPPADPDAVNLGEHIRRLDPELRPDAPAALLDEGEGLLT